MNYIANSQGNTDQPKTSRLPFAYQIFLFKNQQDKILTNTDFTCIQLRISCKITSVATTYPIRRDAHNQ